jgi:hypothetical protein
MSKFKKPINVLEKYQREMISHFEKSYRGRTSHESQESTIIIAEIKNFEKAINLLKKNDAHEIE